MRTPVMISGISSKDVQKARQSAKRKRTSVACSPCKAAKTKCSDYRPCQRCTKSGAEAGCVDDNEMSAKSRASLMSPGALRNDRRTLLDQQGNLVQWHNNKSTCHTPTQSSPRPLLASVSSGREKYTHRHSSIRGNMPDGAAADGGQVDPHISGQIPNHTSLFELPDSMCLPTQTLIPWMDGSLLGPRVTPAMLMGSGYPLQNQQQPQQILHQASHYSGPYLTPITPVPQLTVIPSMAAGHFYSQPFLSQPPDALRLLLGLAALAAPSALRPLQYRR
jgi:hypothetical protein